jgi:hypothetical protein
LNTRKTQSYPEIQEIVRNEYVPVKLQQINKNYD